MRSRKNARGGISHQRINPIMVKCYLPAIMFIAVFMFIHLKNLCRLPIVLYIVSDDRVRRKGNHFLLEGESMDAFYFASDM